MSYVNPKIREQFESLSIDLKNEILARDVRLEDMTDLMKVLQQIVDEGWLVRAPAQKRAHTYLETKKEGPRGYWIVSNHAGFLAVWEGATGEIKNFPWNTTTKLLAPFYAQEKQLAEKIKKLAKKCW